MKYQYRQTKVKRLWRERLTESVKEYISMISFLLFIYSSIILIGLFV